MKIYQLIHFLNHLPGDTEVEIRQGSYTGSLGHDNVHVVFLVDDMKVRISAEKPRENEIEISRYIERYAEKPKRGVDA